MLEIFCEKFLNSGNKNCGKTVKVLATIYFNNFILKLYDENGCLESHINSIAFHNGTGCATTEKLLVIFFKMQVWYVRV